MNSQAKDRYEVRRAMCYCYAVDSISFTTLCQMFDRTNVYKLLVTDLMFTCLLMSYDLVAILITQKANAKNLIFKILISEIP